MLEVPRSSFYAWRSRVETSTQARRRELAVQVRRVFDDSRQTSGCRRVAAQLNREGHECSVGLVADLMRELGLRGRCQIVCVSNPGGAWAHDDAEGAAGGWGFAVW